MNLSDISKILSDNKSILIQVFFCLIYFGIFIFIVIKTIIGEASNTFLYKLLYLIILIFPPAFYLYRSGVKFDISSSMEIKSISSAIKTAVYSMCFIAIIYGIIYLMGNFSFLVGWLSVAIGILIIIIAIALIHESTKDIKIGERSTETGKEYIDWIAFLWKFIFYIPCLVIDFVNYINYQIGITPTPILSLFIFEIVLILVYFYLPDFIAKLEIHDGTQIVKDPLYLNDRQAVASLVSVFPKLESPPNVSNLSFIPNPYDVPDLSGSTNFMDGSGTAIDKYGMETQVKCSDVYMKSGAGYVEIKGCNLEIYDPTYTPGVVNGGNPPTTALSTRSLNDTIRTYSIATWVFINPQPTAVNSYSFPTNILRIGPYNIETATQRTQGKPMLSYFNKVDKENGKYIGTYRIFLSNRDTKYYDIVAPDQKWNFFVFNYSNKIDVFLNGNLVVSASNITPPSFSSTDAFVVGEDGGLDGAIRNTVFFPHTLTTHQIYNIHGGRGI